MNNDSHERDLLYAYFRYCINYLKLNYAINNGLLDLSVRKGGGGGSGIIALKLHIFNF